MHQLSERINLNESEAQRLFCSLRLIIFPSNIMNRISRSLPHKIINHSEKRITILCCLEWCALSNSPHASDSVKRRESSCVVQFLEKLDRAHNSRQQSIVLEKRSYKALGFIFSLHFINYLDNKSGVRNSESYCLIHCYASWCDKESTSSDLIHDTGGILILKMQKSFRGSDSLKFIRSLSWLDAQYSHGQDRVKYALFRNWVSYS